MYCLYIITELYEITFSSKLHLNRVFCCFLKDRAPNKKSLQTYLSRSQKQAKNIFNNSARHFGWKPRDSTCSFPEVPVFRNCDWHKLMRRRPVTCLYICGGRRPEPWRPRLPGDCRCRSPSPLAPFWEDWHRASIRIWISTCISRIVEENTGRRLQTW
jgi:hypothetical protein